jgi:hypothetical protein
MSHANTVLLQEEARANHSVSKLPRFWWYKLLNGVVTFGKTVFFQHPRPIDAAALWDTTLVHELTHAVTPNGKAVDDVTRVVQTTDAGKSAKESYGWYNIYKLRSGLNFNAGTISEIPKIAQRHTANSKQILWLILLSVPSK